jgi:hypothetical protein
MAKLNLSPEAFAKLRQVASADVFVFLGFKLDLTTGDFQDELQQGKVEPQLKNPTMHSQIAELLNTYAKSQTQTLSGKLVKFKDFPAGTAYENAFHRRAVEPVAKLFGCNPQALIEAGEVLGGKRLEYGECSIEIPTLNGLPLTYILWTDEELPPTANILFDESASKYFNVEDLANLADLTTWRLSTAQSNMKSNS